MPRLSHGVPRRRRRVSSSRTDVRRVDKNASSLTHACARSENKTVSLMPERVLP